MGMQANPQEVSRKVDPFLQNVEQDPGIFLNLKKSMMLIFCLSDTQFPVCKGTQVPGVSCIN
jgi:hypothetical protein